MDPDTPATDADDEADVRDQAGRFLPGVAATRWVARPAAAASGISPGRWPRPGWWRW